ncbi:MAG: ABC transporter permease [Rhodothermales bacterium]
MFRAIDFVFIVQVVLSLLTIVFAYDLISGEKESGTLRLMLANAVPRTQYIAAKIAGAWLGLMIPLIIPMLIGVLLPMVFNIPFAGDDWLRLGKLTGYSMLYLTAFLCLGVLFSTLTHRSAMSFLTLLVFWIAMVLVVPRGGMMIASRCAGTLRQRDREPEGRLCARTPERVFRGAVRNRSRAGRAPRKV